MTHRWHEGLSRRGRKEQREREWDPDAYWRWPSAWCLECGVEYSDVVGRIHAARLGHHVTNAQAAQPARLEAAA